MLRSASLLVGTALIGTALLSAYRSGAEARTAEKDVRIEEVDPLVNTIVVSDGANRMLFSISPDTALRGAGGTLTYEDLEPGQRARVRYWDDNLQLQELRVGGRPASRLARQGARDITQAR